MKKQIVTALISLVLSSSVIAECKTGLFSGQDKLKEKEVRICITDENTIKLNILDVGKNEVIKTIISPIEEAEYVRVKQGIFDIKSLYLKENKLNYFVEDSTVDGEKRAQVALETDNGVEPILILDPATVKTIFKENLDKYNIKSS